ncbi:tripartite tricarboxylate transporter substrate binding protein [Paraburkholderia sp. ZP32-5]|uniref:tripartite tricarboxylate transporter substrate binding protein n=1 Tax=Paraburkholderia sp. ZP32-5 TaxID=2883245 RepID=UPI001F28E70B|nr:tripartite tricarboxylate transporter substrate binding protein [Paraburkholderia sp. ZP32-5]
MSVDHARRRLIAAAALLASNLAVAPARALAAGDAGDTSWPDRPIRLIVPLPAGGGADIVARLIGAQLSLRLKQRVVVENKPGGGTVIGAQFVAHAKPDGYTLLLGTATTHAINESLVKHLPYDPIKDFEPVGLAANLPLMLVLNPSVPANTLPELVAYVKAHPGKVNFASTGNGSSIQLAGEMLKIEAKLDMTHVPYQGASPALVDLLGGRVQFMFTTIPPALPYVKSGQLKALCVASRSRSTLLPALPSTTELGYPGVVASSWLGFLYPAQTPRIAIDRTHDALQDVMKMPDLIEKLKKLGVEPDSDTPAEFTQYIQSETARYARVIQISGAKID